MYKHILVPYDGSPASQKGLAEAIRLARDQQASLQVISVAEEYVLTQSAGLGGGAFIGEMMETLAAETRKLVDEAVSQAKSQGVEAFGTAIESLTSRPSDCVVEAARAWPADLIVMGTHGRRGISRMVMGSDAEMVLRSAEVPVLLIRAVTKNAA